MSGRPKVVKGEFEEQEPIRAPRCPGHLLGPAKAEWERITRIMLAERKLSESHLSALTEYCKMFSRSLDLAAMYAEAEGEEARKVLRLEIQLSAELRHREGLLGITPADRARVKALAPPAAADPLGELRNRGRR